MGPVCVKSAKIFKNEHFGKTQKAVAKNLLKKLYQRDLLLSLLGVFGCDLGSDMGAFTWMLAMFSWLVFSLSLVDCVPLQSTSPCYV